jgi:ornithine cyclodeaminase/alanine dehydrogenase-like protein (mu-crystallin family)
VDGVPAYTVKVHAKYPDRNPAIRGVLCLHAADSGDLLAVMDSTHLTAVRTGMTGALAADVLARPDADTVAVLGAGVQGRQQLASLAAFRPLEHVRVYDLAADVAIQFASEMARELRISVEPVSSVAQAVQGAGIVLAATWAREPIVRPDMLAPGTHITTLGADEPGKVEVAAAVIRESLFICDDADLAVEMGALAGAGLLKDVVAAELGDVLAGRHPGRTSPEQVTVYGGVGLAFQDAVCAWAIYQAAREQGVGQTIDFLV